MAGCAPRMCKDNKKYLEHKGKSGFFFVARVPPDNPREPAEWTLPLPLPGEGRAASRFPRGDKGGAPPVPSASPRPRVIFVAARKRRSGVED